MTILELCDQYIEDVSRGRYKTRFNRPKKRSTILTDIGRIETHIKPLLGKLRVSSIDRRTVEKFLNDVGEGKTTRNVKSKKKRGRSIVSGGDGTARRTVGLLSGIMTYAREMGMCESNPVHGVRRGVDQKRTRFLRHEEYTALGEALEEAERHGTNPTAIDAIRLITLTGCRVGEITSLCQNEIDARNGCIRFGDTKTGAQIRPVGKAAFQLLAKLPNNAHSQFVFPATRGNGNYQGLRKVWISVCKRAEIEDATMHTLRHSFGSVAAELNYSDITIAALLGHSLGTVTSRYTHQVDDVMRSAADRVSEEIYTRLNG